MMQALRSFLGTNDMLAYLTMMANRLLELHRVLKPTGSLYLHCDPTASHYLKIVLDAVFGKERFVNEIIWRRTRAHNDKNIAKYGAIHDTLHYYAKGESPLFNIIRTERDDTSPKTHDIYTHTDGKTYRKGDCRAPGNRGPLWTWNGHTFHWRFTEAEAKRLADNGRIVFSKSGMPRVLRTLDTMQGSPLQDVWTDIDAINSGAKELLGYPTQKPIALLERIISASSSEGDVVLDPFCGCGTAVHAAQKLNRGWIGIDITCLAIGLIERRLKDAFGKDFAFEVHGTPKDLDSARDLADRDKYQFQWWAVTVIGAQPYQGKKKGADTGIDGIKYFYDLEGDSKKIVISVKGGAALKPDDVRALNHVRDREKAEIAILISLAEPSAKMRADAASAGIYSGGPGGQLKYSRVQLLTIDGLLSGTQRAEHPDYQRNVNFKKAKREKSPDSQAKIFDDGPDN